MSAKKLGLVLFSGLLMFGTAPVSSAQQTNQDTSKKQTTQKDSAATKDTGKTATGKTTTSETQSATETNTKSQTVTAKKGTAKKSSTDKSAVEKKSTTTDEKSSTDKTGDKKATGAKKTSQLSKDKVKQAQMELKNSGFDPGPIDGVMGTMTMTALRNFQSHNGLQVSGSLNSETESALQSGATASNKTSDNSSSNQSRTQWSHESTNQPNESANQQGDRSGSNIKSHDSNRSDSNVSSTSSTNSLSSNSGGTVNSGGTMSNLEDIRQVQQSLMDLGYLPGDANGMLSSQTQQAIREFQFLNNLPVTGNVDEPTKIALDSQAGGSVENAQLSQREKPAMPSQPEQSSAATSTQSRENRSDSSVSSDASSSSKTTDRDRSYSDHDRSAAKVDRDRNAGKVDKDASERISKAATVLQDLTAANDKRVPNELLQRAEAIAVIPNMIKGAFGIGGRYGKGVISERSESGRWSAPAFIEIGGGSFGAQIGVSSTDLVLVFTDRKAMSMLEGGKDLKLGVDAGVVAGPLGREAEAGVNANLESAIYAYSRSKGLFAGIALDGAVLNMDKDMNAKVYGSSSDAKEILNGSTAANTMVRPFMDALDRVVPKKHISQR